MVMRNTDRLPDDLLEMPGVEAFDYRGLTDHFRLRRLDDFQYIYSIVIYLHNEI